MRVPIVGILAISVAIALLLGRATPRLVLALAALDGRVVTLGVMLRAEVMNRNDLVLGVLARKIDFRRRLLDWFLFDGLELSRLLRLFRNRLSRQVFELVSLEPC